MWVMWAMWVICFQSAPLQVLNLSAAIISHLCVILTDFENDDPHDPQTTKTEAHQGF
jgi:hypothetical protein